MVWSLKPDGCAAPLEPAPIVTSTHGNRSFRQPDGIGWRGVRGGAIHLLEHLVEAVHRAGRVGVVGHAGRELEGARRQASALAMRVSMYVRQARGAGRYQR